MIRRVPRTEASVEDWRRQANRVALVNPLRRQWLSARPVGCEVAEEEHLPANRFHLPHLTGGLGAGSDPCSIAPSERTAQPALPAQYDLGPIDIGGKAV
jgi:hypothetical protein